MSGPVVFPLPNPTATHQLPVTDGHELAVYEYGNPAGRPVIVLHGGPGAGANPLQAAMFDPDYWHIICFDQRGCGQSRVHGQANDILLNNNTAAIVEDIEAIRRHFAIQKWLVAGGSWGSTLALVYAIHHPEVVQGLILRGVFLARPSDSEWLYGQHGGAAQLFPEFYHQFTVDVAPAAPAAEVIARYHQLLHDPDSKTAQQAAIAWVLWEARIATLTAKSGLLTHVSRDPGTLAAARIGSHFFQHQFFLEPNAILNQLARITHLPAVIVHGRYDIVCPLSNAHALAERWSKAQLKIVQDAGHSSTERGIAQALVTAGKQFQQQHG